MKIALKDLEPNPFKKFINEGKLDKEKIELLKESINKDGFWDNVLCRKKNDKYELAYGHHRIEAAKQILGKDYEADIPCKDLSDESMLRILGNENTVANQALTIYQIDQVKITKTFLAEHPQISSSWKSGQDKGHGQKPDDAISISKFLGEKNWSKSKVAELLKLDRNLHPEIKQEIKNAGNVGGESIGELTKSHAISLSRASKEEQLKILPVIKKVSREEADAVIRVVTDKDLTRHEKDNIIKKVKKRTLKGKEDILREGMAKKLNKVDKKLSGEKGDKYQTVMKCITDIEIYIQKSVLLMNTLYPSLDKLRDTHITRMAFKFSVFWNSLVKFTTAIRKEMDKRDIRGKDKEGLYLPEPKRKED